MNISYRSIPGLEALAFASLALGVLGFIFFWMPAAGVCLAALGLAAGFFGWLTASHTGDGSSFYLLVGSFVSLAGVLLNMALATGMLGGGG